MARPTTPDHDKRLNVGLRLHPTTLQHLDEILVFFQGLRQTNPMLPFGFPQSRTDVVEFLLREGVRDFVTHALAWHRIGSHRELPTDLGRMADSRYWNVLLSTLHLDPASVPQSWLETEWPPIARPAPGSAPADLPVVAAAPETPAKRGRKPRKS